MHMLDMDSGEVVARTAFAAYPLAVDAESLIGFRPSAEKTSELVLFAVAKEGEALSPIWEARVELPEWVVVDASEPSRFALVADIRADSIVATWEAHSRYQGGAPPPRRVEEAATHDEEGTIRLDRKTGAVLDQKPAVSAPAAEPIPALSPIQQISPYRYGTGWRTTPWRVGSSTAFLVRTTDRPGITLVRRGADGDVIGEREVGKESTAEAAVALDGAFVLVHEPQTDAWHVFAAESGERIASLPFDAGTQGVSVVRDRVLYLVVEDVGSTRRKWLRCRNLATGDAIWSYLLTEETRGSPPLPR